MAGRVTHNNLAVGIDFGTSNSAAAVGHGADQSAQVIAIDARAEDPRLLRSVLFFPHGAPDVWVGSAAIAQYLNSEEGRFIQSVKTFLPSQTFERTQVRGKSWQIEDLVAAVLRPIRERVEAAESRPITHLVLGRPALFSEDPAVDARAETRLREAARRAGFPAPTFVIEPIAAALAYEETLQHDELVLVADFGAGTSDFTLMQLGPSFRNQLQRREHIVASTGVYVGGDRFDALIVEHALLQYFGVGSTYMAFTERTPLPGWIARKLLRWHELSILRERDTLEFLQRAAITSDAPEGMRNLICLVEDNLAYHLYRAVEEAKRALSHRDEATVKFCLADIDFEQVVLRRDFETWMAPLLKNLSDAVDKVLAQAPGRTPDAVFLTGGTSKIPAVRQLFAERFGADRLREGDAFTSVVAGLGRAAAVLTAALT